jgi:hypothetical protein
MNKKWMVLLGIVLVCSLMLFGCGGGGGGDDDDDGINAPGDDPGDGTKDTFVAVTNITGVPTSEYMNFKLTLSGTVAPDTATNKTIVWSLVDGGGTGVTALGGDNSFTATAAGTVKVKATIANGATASTPYTKEFSITIPDKVVISVNVGGTPQKVEVGVGNATLVSVPSGYQYTTTGSWNAYSYFEIDIGTKTIANISTVKANVTLGGTDLSNKPINVAASEAKPTVYPGSNGNNYSSGDAGKLITLINNFGSNGALTGKVYILLSAHVNTSHTVNFTNVEINFTP